MMRYTQILSSKLVFFVFFLIWSNPLAAISFDSYHDQAFIAQYLRQVAEDHSNIARFKKLGRSHEGREIALVVLTKGAADNKPAIYINGTHHGNEKASTEASLGLIDYLVKNQDNLVIDQFLERYAIFIQPLVNPDGHARNSRFDSTGRDPNRDYAFPGRSEDQSFQLVETRLVRDLMRRHNFVASAAYHSGLEAVLWPWCHTKIPTNDHTNFVNVGRMVAEAMNISLFTQSYHDYRTEGEFIDYAYMEHGTFALTFEVSRSLNPPTNQLPRVVQRSIRGTLAFLSSIKHLASSPQVTELSAH